MGFCLRHPLLFHIDLAIIGPKHGSISGLSLKGTANAAELTELVRLKIVEYRSPSRNGWQRFQNPIDLTNER